MAWTYHPALRTTGDRAGIIPRVQVEEAVEKCVDGGWRNQPLIVDLLHALSGLRKSELIFNVALVFHESFRKEHAMSTDAKRPLVSYAVGGFSVALWENVFDNGNGTQRTARSVSLRRSFFNKKEDKLDDQTINVNPQEIGCLIQLLSRMEQAVVEERSRHEPF